VGKNKRGTYFAQGSRVLSYSTDRRMTEQCEYVYHRRVTNTA